MQVKSSRLLPLVFEGFSADDPLSVLDAGDASPETVAFFGRIQCRLHVADLYTHTAFLGDASPETTNWSEVAEALGDSNARQFDILLFWDFLNFLDGPRLRSFSEVILPYVHKGSRAHAILAFSSANSVPRSRYSIKDVDQILVEDEEESLIPHVTSRREIERHLPWLTVSKSVLWRDNRLELVMFVNDEFPL